MTPTSPSNQTILIRRRIGDAVPHTGFSAFVFSLNRTTAVECRLRNHHRILIINPRINDDPSAGGRQRLLVTAVMVAAKFLEDEVLPNAAWSRPASASSALTSHGVLLRCIYSACAICAPPPPRRARRSVDQRLLAAALAMGAGSDAGRV